MAVSQPAVAQDTRYRVEIIVLRILEQDEPALEREEIRDYSAAIDFLTPIPEEEPGETGPEGDENLDVEDAGGTGQASLVEESADEAIAVELTEPDPNRVEYIAEMGSVMQEAWRRLRLSGPFRPEQYLSWEQGSEPPFPTLRIHDLETVLVDDPWADYRQTPVAESGQPAPGAETVTVFADAAGLDALNSSGQESPLEIEGPQLPDPVYYYRLDGTVNFTRSRFLHLDLDLQWRQPEPDALVPFEPSDRDPAIRTRPDPPSMYRVYELRQNRQVRTGRMEYFDGPVLGVLAYITEVVEEAGENLD